MVVVSGDHDRTPSREEIEQYRLETVEVLVLVDKHYLVGVDRLRMCLKRTLNPEHRIVETYGAIMVTAFERERRRGSRFETPHQADELRRRASAGNGPVGRDERGKRWVVSEGLAKAPAKLRPAVEELAGAVEGRVLAPVRQAAPRVLFSGRNQSVTPCGSR